MRKVIFALLGVLLVSACEKYKYDEVKGDVSKTRIYTLDNGLKVYLSVNKETPRIQTYIAVRTGSKNDPAETTGLAHYLEHLMFKGTASFGTTNPEAEAPLLADIEQRYEKYRKLTDPEARRRAYHEIDSVSQEAARYFIPNEYDKMMSAIGAEGTNAYTSNDVTCYTEDIPANQVENWLKIEANRFKGMTIRGFHTELEAVYEEYNIHLAYDYEKMYDAMMTKLFPSHPYGTQTTIGTQEHLKNPSITNIKSYFSKWYVPNNVAICMAGDFDPDQVMALIEQYFGDWQKGDDVAQPTFAEQPQLTQPADTTVVGLEAEQLLMAWRFAKGSSLEADTLEVMDYMMSNGTAGLLDLDINQQLKMRHASSTTDRLMDYSSWQLMGRPRDGQTLDDVRQLLLAEVEKLKAGDFSDDLLPSVINNLKLDYYTSMESNEARADMAVEAFINGTPWQQVATKMDRISGITKQQMVDFARRHLTDGYVAVYKRQGNDPNQKKIDKPTITPIPTNRDTVSQFVKDILAAEVKSIEPRFIDFKRDLAFGNTQQGLPYVYVQNTDNGRFTLNYRFDFGADSDVRYDYAARYLEYIGTDSLTPQQVKQQFYKLACRYSVSVGSRYITVSLSGLSDNMAEAAALLEHVMTHAQPNADTYREYLAVLDKSRRDNKLNQQYNFYALYNYGLYGAYNPMTNILTDEQLQQTDPAELLNLLKTLSQYEHTLLYYGPMSESQLCEIVDRHHRLSTPLKAVPEGKHYEQQLTTQNEILLAPYDAKNVYMRLYNIEDRQWNPDEAGVKALFNEYYGGNMGSIVFQELREARGLAYNAWAGYFDPTYKDQKEYSICHIIAQNDKLMDCVRQFHAILDTIPRSEASLRVAKEAVMKRIASQRTTRFSLISAWLDAKQRGIDYDENERVYQTVPSLTLDDIVRFASQRMAGKPHRYVILGNEHDLDIKALQQYGPIRRLTTSDIFGY